MELGVFRKSKSIPPRTTKMLVKKIHAFVLMLLKSGGDDVGVIYYDDLLERFVFRYVVGSKMLKIVFDEASIGLELYDNETLETKLPHLFTEEDWNTVFMILNSARNYVMSYFEPGVVAPRSQPLESIQPVWRST